MSNKVDERITKVTDGLGSYEGRARALLTHDRPGAPRPQFWGIGRLLGVDGHEVFAAASHTNHVDDRPRIAVRFAVVSGNGEGVDEDMSGWFTAEPCRVARATLLGSVVMRSDPDDGPIIEAYPTFRYPGQPEHPLPPFHDVVARVGVAISALAAKGERFAAMPKDTRQQRQTAHAVRPVRPAVPDDLSDLARFTASPENGPAFLGHYTVPVKPSGRRCAGEVIAQFDPIPELPPPAG
jgi:hypothetical protein